ncbi:MAG: hypothetical protein JWP30_937 [Homoserinimonas sp.]|jgi:diacylglycerol kinase family enzyme/membrane-associated phospholipid phosphatase|nr:hypothetical protein [Homoserinimonas sp.]
MSTSPSRIRNPFVALRRLQLLPPWVRRMDVTVARRVNARHAHPVVDRGYARLSTSANRSVLWFSVAGLLLLFARPRPALRGVISLTVASMLANLVGKNIFGGDRPLLKDIPVGRRLKKPPTSPSFPSGHSASAAAFATGVALESRDAGLAVAPIAAAVAYSRLHVGAHWFSDVVGGSALGAGVALAGKVLVPARAKPHPREGGIPLALPALPDGEGAFIVVNPSAGSARSDPVEVISRRLPRARVHVLADGEDMVTVIRDAVASGGRPTVLGVCGGDGTVASVAHQARKNDVPLLVLPGGTFNHFAGTLRIASIEEAIDSLQAGTGVRVDIGEGIIDDGEAMTVINAASVGVYPEFVAERDKYQARLGKWLAGIVAAVRVLRTAAPVEVTINGERTRVWSLFVGVNRNYLATVAPMQRRRLDDGLLDVRMVHASSRPRAGWALVFGRRTSVILRKLHVPGSDQVDQQVTDAVRLTVHAGSAGVARDGEAEERSAPYVAKLHNLPGGLKVYAPDHLR